MKKFVLIALAASCAAIAAPAAAQSVTGTVVITGTVAPKCMVVPGNGSTFGTTIALGELAQASGIMRTDLAAQVNADAGLTARVICTTAAPTISVDANPLANGVTVPPTGYDNSIDFTASVSVTTTTGVVGPFNNATSSAPLAATPIGGRLANNGANNIAITTSGFATNTLTDVLESGSYSGNIIVVIAPGA